MAAPTHIPSVSTLHAAEGGDGLLLKGYAARWSLDRVGDSFSPFSLDRTVKAFMSSNPVLLFSHNYGLPPVGEIVNAEIHRDKGLFVEALMPKPAPGTFASEIYEAAKNGILRAFSVGGKWLRQDKGTHHLIFDADLSEISLCPVAVNPDTYATEIEPTAVKCFGGGYMPAAEYEAAMAATRERLALAEVSMTLAENVLRSRR